VFHLIGTSCKTTKEKVGQGTLSRWGVALDNERAL